MFTLLVPEGRLERVHNSQRLAEMNFFLSLEFRKRLI